MILILGLVGLGGLVVEVEVEAEAEAREVMMLMGEGEGLCGSSRRNRRT